MKQNTNGLLASLLSGSFFSVASMTDNGDQINFTQCIPVNRISMGDGGLLIPLIENQLKRQTSELSFVMHHSPVDAIANAKQMGCDEWLTHDLGTDDWLLIKTNVQSPPLTEIESGNVRERLLATVKAERVLNPRLKTLIQRFTELSDGLGEKPYIFNALTGDKMGLQKWVHRLTNKPTKLLDENAIGWILIYSTEFIYTVRVNTDDIDFRIGTNDPVLDDFRANQRDLLQRGLLIDNGLRNVLDNGDVIDQKILSTLLNKTNYMLLKNLKALHEAY